MENDLIKFKGAGDGVKIYFNSSADFSEIMNNLRSKLDKFRHFFGNGYCNIYFIGRKFDKSEMLRLEALVKSMLPDCVINYGEKKVIHDEAAGEVFDSDIRELEEIKEVITTNFKSNRARFYEGVVRNGKRIESDCHLILVGDVEKGARVAAMGNIVILGKLYGSAEAGSMGSKSAYIIASDFSPEKITIGGVSVYEFQEHINGAVKAVLTDNQIYTYEFLVK